MRPYAMRFMCLPAWPWPGPCDDCGGAPLRPRRPPASESESEELPLDDELLSESARRRAAGLAALAELDDEDEDDAVVAARWREEEHASGEKRLE
jgi:hypothetical protein